jgi:hypothetical protein
LNRNKDGKIGRDIRQNVKSATRLLATVVDTSFGTASVRLKGNGAVIRHLEVVGGPVQIGDQVIADFSTTPPTIAATGNKGITRDNVLDIMAGQEPKGQGTLIYPPFVDWIPTSGSGGTSGSGLSAIDIYHNGTFVCSTTAINFIDDDCS